MLIVQCLMPSVLTVPLDKPADGWKPRPLYSIPVIFDHSGSDPDRFADRAGSGLCRALSTMPVDPSRRSRKNFTEEEAHDIERKRLRGFVFVRSSTVVSADNSIVFRRTVLCRVSSPEAEVRQEASLWLL